MAEVIHVAGPVEIYVQHPVQEVTEFALGYSANGVELRHTPFWSNYHSDANGGQEGPPTDVLLLGETATIRAELTRWDADVAARVCSRAYGRPRPPWNTSGQGKIAPAGTLMLSPWGVVTEAAMLVRLVYRAGSRIYYHAFLRNAHTLNMGSRFSRLVLEWDCYARAENGSLFYDSTGT